jgi:thiamine-phosphate pyrophosphorylase
MIVISNPETLKNEIKIVHTLFEEGLELFHIRKPYYSENQISAYIAQIGNEYRSRLVLHHHHHLSEHFEINRIHFTEKQRKELSRKQKEIWKSKKVHLSTSIHKIERFNTLENEYEYAFISPVFTSISKEKYYPQYDFTTEIKKRTNFSTRLVALGGISCNTILEAKSIGFDKVALLGEIWNTNHPIDKFKKCQKIVHSFSQ